MTPIALIEGDQAGRPSKFRHCAADCSSYCRDPPSGGSHEINSRFRILALLLVGQIDLVTKDAF
jgi:hypothetical protein